VADTTLASGVVPNEHRIEKFTTVARRLADVYAAWRDLESLPLVMPNLERVQSEGSLSRWSIAGTDGEPLSWEAEILVDQPGERISWRADDAPVKHAGTVRFEPAPGGRGTEVTIEIRYVRAAGAPPQRLLEVDLRRFKSVLEMN
jgi:uncharacterized membrane protein